MKGMAVKRANIAMRERWFENLDLVAEREGAVSIRGQAIGAASWRPLARMIGQGKIQAVRTKPGWKAIVVEYEGPNGEMVMDRVLDAEWWQDVPVDDDEDEDE